MWADTPFLNHLFRLAIICGTYAYIYIYIYIYSSITTNGEVVPLKCVYILYAISSSSFSDSGSGTSVIECVTQIRCLACFFPQKYVYHLVHSGLIEGDKYNQIALGVEAGKYHQGMKTTSLGFRPSPLCARINCAGHAHNGEGL